MRRRAGSLVGLMIALASCSRNSDRQAASAAESSQRFRRAIQVGASVTPRFSACADSVHRTIGDSARAQIVTFATAEDCLACGTHAPGLETIRTSGVLDEVDFVTVLYASVQHQRTAVRSLRTMSNSPICFDTAGAFWSELDVSHTPVTLLLLRGTIAFVYDGLLGSPASQGQFVDTVHALLTDARFLPASRVLQ